MQYKQVTKESIINLLNDFEHAISNINQIAITKTIQNENIKARNHTFNSVKGALEILKVISNNESVVVQIKDGKIQSVNI